MRISQIRLDRKACDITGVTYLAEPENLVFIARIRFYQRVHSRHLNDDLDLVLDIYKSLSWISYMSAGSEGEATPTSIIDQAHESLTTCSMADEDNILSIRQPRDCVD